MSTYLRTAALFATMLVAALSACGPAQDEIPAGAPVAEAADGRDANPTDDALAPYSFDQPTSSFSLPDDLKEISGLTVLADGRLGAIQDEEGRLFILNAETGHVEEERAFGGPEDYEGVEWAGDRLFVLRANGTLIELSDWQQASPAAQEHKTDLKGKNDTEGLGYDRAANRLLIACKENPGDGLNEDDLKAIYAFDLNTSTLSTEPVITIDLNALDRMAPGNGSFKPSALAVHPHTGVVHVLSSTRKAIAVLTPDGNLQAVWALPESLFVQPEGLAFDADGDLYIASEGGDGPGKLYRFSK